MTKELVQIENFNVSELLGEFREVKTLLIKLTEQSTRPTLPEPNDYLTQKETLQLLKINASTAWKWERNNRLIAYRIGSKKYYKRSEIETLINNSKTV